MSNIIPPLLSSTPPPIGNIEDDDDEFGDFTTAVDHTYGCDALSIPNTPTKLPIIQDVDINSNSNTLEDLKIVPDDEEVKEEPQPKTDVPSVPNIPTNGIVQSVETTTNSVPDNDDFNDHTDLNVPSCPTPTEIDDVYREEPPDIILDDEEEEEEEESVEEESVVSDKCDKLSGERFEFIDDCPVFFLKNDGFNNVESAENEKNTEKNVVDVDKSIITSEVEVEKSVIASEDYVKSSVNSSEDNFKNSVIDSEVKNVKNSVFSAEFIVDTSAFPAEPNVENSADFNAFPAEPKVENSADFNAFPAEPKVENSDDFNAFPAEPKVENSDDFNAFPAEPKVKNSAEFNAEFDVDSSTFVPETNSESPVDFDDFADFKTPNIDDDFGDFTTVQFQPKLQEQLPELPKPQQNTDDCQDDDDFGDFDDFTTSSTIPVVNENILLNSTDAFEKAKKIIEQMFLPMDLIAYDCDLCDFIAEDSIFKEIKDVTDTNALTYQWAKSESQKGLLKSLKIDTRNILYGHGRNVSMPKFAANLGLTPLEPTKSELLTPTTPPITTPPLHSSAPPTTQQQPITSHHHTENIPSAQFDWTESGLANPLDSVSKDPEPEANAEMVTSTKQFDTESVNSLQFADIPAEVETEVPKPETDNFDDFTSFQKSDDFSNGNWNNMVPLRETHINSVENKKVEIEEPGWLKPTILTPVLPRNDKIGKIDKKQKNEDIQVSANNDLEDDFGGFHSGEVKKTNFEVDEFSRFDSIGKDSKDIKESQDFTGFSLSTPKIDSNTFNSSIKIDTMQDFTGFGLIPSNVDIDGIKSNNAFIKESTDFTGFGVAKNDLDMFKSNDSLGFSSSSINSVKAQETQDFVGFGPPTTKQKDLGKDFIPFGSIPTKSDLVKPIVKEDDDFDDFTSFQSPPKQTSKSQTKEILQPNILQPSILQPVPTYSAPTQINWPDPGVTDEELARFDIFSQKTEFKTETPKPKEPEKSPQVQRLSGTTGLLLVEKSVVVPANKVVLPSKEILLPPNNKVVISKDLVLPILESSPRKYTPNKVKNDEDDWTDFVSSSDVKTERISTPELSLCIPQLSNIQPPKLPIPVITAHGLMQTKIPSTMPPTQKPPMHQPLHVNPPTDGYQPSIISNQFAMQLNQNLFQTTNIPSKMSPYHKPQNGLKTISNSDDEWSDFVSSRPVGNNVFNGNWGNAQTNIISNPTAHYQNQGSLNGTTKRNIPSISSLPELDFVAPNGRSFKSKK